MCTPLAIALFNQYSVLGLLGGVTLLLFVAGFRARGFGTALAVAIALFCTAASLFIAGYHYTGSYDLGSAAALVTLLAYFAINGHRLVFHGQRWRSARNRRRGDSRG